MTSYLFYIFTRALQTSKSLYTTSYLTLLPVPTKGAVDYGRCDYGECEYGGCDYGGCVSVRVWPMG